MVPENAKLFLEAVEEERDLLFNEYNVIRVKRAEGDRQIPNASQVPPPSTGAASEWKL